MHSSTNSLMILHCSLTHAAAVLRPASDAALLLLVLCVARRNRKNKEGIGSFVMMKIGLNRIN